MERTRFIKGEEFRGNQNETGFSRLRYGGNIIEGYQSARRTAGRKLINVMESTGFAVVFSEQTRTVPRTEAVAHTYRLQDILERQNCYGDERVAQNNSSNPYWERDHYIVEYANTLKDIKQDLTDTYGPEQTQVRFPTIVQALSRWFIVNKTVEEWQAHGKQSEDLTLVEAEILEPLLKDSSPKNYREFVADSWLRALTTVIADGDQTTVDTAMPTLLNAALALQLSEDFANVERDNRVGKNSFYTQEADEGNTIFQRVKSLQARCGEYLDMLELTGPQKLFAESAWVARSLVAFAFASRNPQEWRKTKLYADADTFEMQKLDTLVASAQLTNADTEVSK